MNSDIRVKAVAGDTGGVESCGLLLQKAKADLELNLATFLDVSTWREVFVTNRFSLSVYREKQSLMGN